MRIFLVARGYPTKQSPQWGCFEKDQAVALAQMGHEVVILSYRQHPLLPNIGFRIIDEDGIHAVCFSLLPGLVFGQHGSRLRARFEQWELAKAYACAMELYGKPDIIYSHYLFVSFIALSLHERFSIPIVAMEHWSELNREPMHAYVKRMAINTYSNLNKLLAVSEPLRDRIDTTFNVHSQVVHNLISADFRYDNASYPETFTLVSVGSLFPVKNHALLIKALAQIELPKTKWQLIIIGEGGERDNLQRLIDNSDLSSNIHLAGLKSKLDVATILRNSSVFVLPSNSENFSVAVLEAMSCGLPVIASICGGIRECVDSSNGMLFEVGDINGLTQCLHDMYEHHREYDRKKISEECRKRFSSEVIARQLTEVFAEVVKSNDRK